MMLSEQGRPQPGPCQILTSVVLSAKVRLLPNPLFRRQDAEISTGHFGKVYLAQVKAPAEPFILVLKCLTKDEVISKGVQTQVRREIEVTLDSPCIREIRRSRDVLTEM